MKVIMRYLTGAALAAAALSALPQSATHELSLSDIKAQWPEETLFASAPCQRTLKMQPLPGQVMQVYTPDPKTFVPDLHTLMEKSEEVILAAPQKGALVVLSPSREHVVTYTEVKVIRSWKGPHDAGDTLVLGLPEGELVCEPRAPANEPATLRTVHTGGPRLSFYNMYVLFLRHAKGEETKLIQGLFVTAGDGTQGVFQILHTDSDDDSCARLERGGFPEHPNVENCDTFMQTNQNPVDAGSWDPPDTYDPLYQKYNDMPASDFLREVQSAAGQGLAEESSLK